MSEQTPPDRMAELSSEIVALRQEVARLNAQPFLREVGSTGRTVMFQFFRGLAFGLGTVVGASLLVSVFAYLLAQVDFIPIIGEWAARIADEIRQR